MTNAIYMREYRRRLKERKEIEKKLRYTVIIKPLFSKTEIKFTGIEIEKALWIKENISTLVDIQITIDN